MRNLHLLAQTFSQACHASGTGQINGAWPSLTKEIIELLIAGQSNKGMARTLNLSEGTIKFHMSAVMRLLGAKSRVEAATRAMKYLNR